MPPRRFAEPGHTVRLVVDGDDVVAADGEPVAVALAAAGRLVLGRSVKYHRPRGAACYAGRCDGCLMRVDGISSVRTCRTPAREGMVVETQNVLGSAERDLLAATDWFFPDGMDHHHMFTAFRPLNQIMQKVARRIAGIGRLPDETRRAVEPGAIASEVLVVGAGPAGLAAAAALARAGRDVCVVDDEPEPGGHLLVYPEPVCDDSGREREPRDLAATLARDAASVGATLRAGATAVAIDDRRSEGHAERPADDAASRWLVAVDGDERLSLARPRAIVIATGAHEGSLAVNGNDLPGVIGARAAGRLIAAGVLPGARVVVAGEGAWAEAVARALRARGAEVVGPLEPSRVSGVLGGASVRRVELAAGDDDLPRRIDCDAVVLAAPPSAAYELAAQAGAEVALAGDGFAVVTGEGGRTRAPFVRAAGECVGAADAAAAILGGRARRRLARGGARPWLTRC